jgi:hypothetical protein
MQPVLLDTASMTGGCWFMKVATNLFNDRRCTPLPDRPIVNP